MPQLYGSHLKSWRAWEVACALQASIERWVNSGGYRSVREEVTAGEHRVHIRFNELPGEWSLLIGESVQNMRNSLDNLVFGLSELHVGRATRGRRGPSLCYPIHGPNALPDSRRDAALGLIPTDVRDFVVQTQPHNFKGGYGQSRLWALHELSNQDKHRAIPTYLVSMDMVRTTGPVSSFECVAPKIPIVDGDWVALVLY